MADQFAFYEELSGEEHYPPYTPQSYVAGILEELKAWGFNLEPAQMRLIHTLVMAAAADAALIERLKRPTKASIN